MEIMKHTPAVFAVETEYQIMVPVNAPCVMWVKVGDEVFYDQSNGILRSDTDVHRMTVPMALLNRERRYTVFWKEVYDRKPYFPELGEEQSAGFSFRPCEGGGIRAYMISDAHGMREEPIAAAEKFAELYGAPDLLILNGDILSNSGDTKNFDLYYDFAEVLTGGEIPTIVSRGNHDLRGKCAEKLADYMPGSNGRSYYTIRLGGLWAALLDLGEDKGDGNAEYNGTICCHDFRKRETDFFEEVAENENDRFHMENAVHRIVISHVPLTRADMAPAESEQPFCKRWVELLNEKIKPEFMLSGHTHWQYIAYPGSKWDGYGMRFPTVVGAFVDRENPYFAGCGLVWEKEGVRVVFNDGRSVLQETVLPE